MNSPYASAKHKPRGASFGLRAVSAAAATGLTLAASTGFTAIESPAAQASTSAIQEYSGGSGEYAKMIQWLDWKVGQNFATPADVPAGVTLVRSNMFKVGTFVEQELAPGYVVRAEVIEMGGQTTPNSMGLREQGGTNNQITWARPQNPDYSEMRKTGYPTSGFTTISPAANGGVISIKFKLTAIRDGVAVPVDAIFTDGESANPNEFIGATTDGAPWIPLFNTSDTSRPMWLDQPNRVNAGFGTQTMGGFTDAYRRVPVGMSRDTRTITVNVSSGGQQDAMLGFFFPVDSGDAPASYGKALAQMKFIPNAELTTVDPKQPDNDAPDAPKLVDQQSIYFGTTKPDADTVHVGTWGEDGIAHPTDTRVVNDENVTETLENGAFPALAQCTDTYAFSVNATAPDGTPVAGWIDFNNNGTFDNAERAASTVQSGKATLTFANAAVPNGVTQVGSRLWISSMGALLATPVGASPDGEVQDHLIPVTDTCVPTTQTGLQGQKQTSDAKTMFPDTDLTGASFNFGKDPAGAPMLSQPALDADGNAVGTHTIDPTTGVITFTPNSTFVGTAQPVSVKLDLPNGSTFGSTHTSTVTPVTPGASPDTTTTPQGSAVTLSPLTNDTPGDATAPLKPETVKLTAAGLPEGATVTDDGKSATVPGEGTYTVNSDGSVTFTPEPEFVGSATPINYTVEDANGTPTTSTITIDVVGVKDVSKTGIQGDPVTVPPALQGIDPSTVTLLEDGLPPGSTVTDEGKRVTAPGEGTWTVNPDGSMTFTPEDGFQGDPTPIKYTGAATPGGPTAPPATVTVDYPDVNDITGSGNQGEPVTVKPSLDEDAIPNTVQVTTEGLPDGSTISDGGKTVTVPGEGTWTVNPDGDITFTPNADFQGDPTPIKYTAQDNDGNVSEPGTVTITYPDVPDVTGSGNQGVPLTTKPPLDGDMDPGTLTFIPDGTPAGSTPSPDGKTLVVPNEGTWSITPNGDITFTPEDGFQGDPTPVQFTGNDKGGNTPTPGTITFTFPDVPDVTGSGNQGVPLTAKPPLDGDMDPGTLTFVPDDLPDGSTITGGGKSVTVPGEGTWTITPDGSITFTPEDGFQGDPTPIKFTGKDKNGNTPTPSTITFTFPDVPDVTGNGDQGKPLTVTPKLDGDIDPGTLTFTPDGTPPGTEITPDGKTAKVPNEGTWTITPDGSITFTPEDGFQGDPTPIKFTGNDNGGNTSTPGIITFTFPDVPDVKLTGEPGKPLTSTPPLDGDMDPGTLTFVPDSAPPGSTITSDGKTITVPNEGTWSITPNGGITFTPKEGFTGNPTPIQFTGNDKAGNTSTPGTITFTFPDVPDVTGRGEQGKPSTVTPTFDPDIEPGTVTFPQDGQPTGSIVTPDGKTITVPNEGTWTVNPNGSLTFTPNDDFTGDPTTVKYTADDKNGDPAPPATATITYPDVENSTGTGTTGQPITIKPPMDADAIPSSLTLIPDGLPSGSTISTDGKTAIVPNEGTWTVNPDGSLTFTPQDGFTGNPTPIKYIAKDKDGNPSLPGTATITYPAAPSNPAQPVAPVAPDSGTILPSWLATTGVNGLLAGGITAALVAAGVALRLVGRRKHK